MIFSILGFGLVTVIVSFFVLELMLRVRNWARKTFFVKEVRRKDFFAAEYQDYINWIDNWDKPMFKYLPIGFRLFNNDNQIAPVKNNSLGFRCEEFSEPKKDELRLVILGGSSAWGCGASSNQATIAGQLEKLINSDKRLLGSFKRAKCYNLSQVNSTQTQDLLIMLFFASKVKPHYVVSFTGWNELATNYCMKSDIMKKFSVFYINEMEEWLPLGVGKNKFDLLKKAFRLWGIKKSDVIKMLYSFNRPKKCEGLKLSPKEQVTLGTELFIDHLSKMQKLARAFDFKHFQFLQPYLYRKEFLTEQEKKIIHLYDDLRPVIGGREIGNFLRENNMYSSIMSIAQEDSRMGSIIDFCDIFRQEKESMFYTLVHLTDTGYRKIAEGIYATLLNSFQDKVGEGQLCRD